MRRRRIRAALTVTSDAGPAAPERWSACYAPHTSLYFDQLGKVRACCQNTGVYLGDVSEQTLHEIWRSHGAERLRTALEANDHSAGCDFCAWQVREGNEEILFSRQYDGLRPSERRPTWPRQMEFALSNTCNLQCTMCNGEWSSAIRSRRERLPPLPRPYGDPFFEQLAAFLPHLESVHFSGGEPFLGAEPLRVMEMLMELDEPPQVTVITNGTQLGPRVEEIVRRLRPRVIVSIDGANANTYDAVRVGAHLPDVLANLDDFRAKLGNDRVSITTCLMTSNWREFADVLELAERRSVDVGVNVVRAPAEFSLYAMEEDALADVVRSLTSRHVELSGSRLHAWDGHRRALTQRLGVIRANDPTLGPAHGLPGAPLPPMPSSPWPWLPFPEEGRGNPPAALPPISGSETRLWVDTDGTIHLKLSDVGAPLDVADLDRQSVDQLMEKLLRHFPDQDAWTYAGRLTGVDEDRFCLWLAAPGTPDVAAVEMLGVATRDADGTLTGATYVFRTARTITATVPSWGTQDG